MTVTSGFFNSKNHDRLYNAEQLSSIFDGVITDGIFQSIGDAFFVHSLTTSDNTVLVGTGRAWFDRTWILNDSPYAVTLDPSSSALGRIDAVVLDIDKTENVRKNSIMLLKGTYSESPQRPTLIKESRHKQYPLCYITVPVGSSGPISDFNITNMIGTEDCPLITGILDTLDIDMFVNQMESKFDVWFNDLQVNLEGNVATNLQNQINDLKETIEDANAGAINSSTLEKVKNINLKKMNIVPGDSYKCYYTFMLKNYGFCTIERYSDGMTIILRACIYNTDGILQNSETLLTIEYSSEDIVPNIVDVYYIENDLRLYLSYPSYTKRDAASASGYLTGCVMNLIELNFSAVGFIITKNNVQYTGTFADDYYYTFAAGNSGSIEVSNTNFPLKLDNGDIINAVSSFLYFRGSDYHNDGGSTYAFVLSSDHVLKQKTEIAEPFQDEIGIYQSANPSKNDYICLSLLSKPYGTDTSWRAPTALLDSKDYSFVSKQYDEVYETDLNYIKASGNGLIVSSSTTIGNYSNRYLPSSYIDIPMSIEVSWSLDSVESFGTWESGIMSPDKNMLIIGSNSKIRIGVIPDIGLMIWGKPIDSNVLSSNSNAIAQIALPSNMSWWVNDTKTKYIFINGWGVTTNTGSDKYYSVKINTLSTPTILTIDMGD